MKTLHQINIWAFAFALLLYFLVYTALAGLIMLAVIQSSTAIYIFIKHYKVLDKKRRRLIIDYWYYSGCALMCILASYYHDKFFNDLYAITSLFIIPTAIACYFLYTTASIKKYLTRYDNDK